MTKLKHGDICTCEGRDYQVMEGEVMKAPSQIESLRLDVRDAENKNRKLHESISALEKRLVRFRAENAQLREFIADMQKLAAETSQLSNTAVERWCAEVLNPEKEVE